MNSIAPYSDYSGIRANLVEDGWRTPNTYCNLFAPITDISAVYLFLMIDNKDFNRGLVAYVGMSQNLQQRLSGHQILSEIMETGHWVMKWFKPTEPDDLRDVEAKYIIHFDPPWNIAGKQRGVAGL